MLLNVGCVVSYLTLNVVWCASCNSTSHVTDLVESTSRKRRKLHVAVDLRHLRQCRTDSASLALWSARKNQVPALECMVTPGRNIFYQLPGLRKSRTLSPAWLSRRPTIHGPKRHLRFLVRQTPCCTTTSCSPTCYVHGQSWIMDGLEFWTSCSSPTRSTLITGWWFGTCFICPYIGNNNPNWLIFFRGVETANQISLI